ncbi:hypothetical protein MTR67_044507 [Solanum verrucosum]|uniref:Tf2-1-like SH3-like domain-containing protein n=1 Tax=Solanum verrucosum TaxID=315347 RepID=A0AAF0ZSZ4_SOLVR|nr:hypothetical protein MTR67_044507 [Solanum verrucosum]
MKGVMRFGKKGKLSPKYVGPYRILKRIGKVAYELELSADLAAVHPVFHISLLKKCVGDPASIVPLESVAVKDSLSYEDVPVEILDRQVRRLRNKEVASVKVLWRSQTVEGATWEAEAAMKSNVFACPWNSVQSEIQFSVFSGKDCSPLPPFQLVYTSFEDEWSQGGDNVRPRPVLVVRGSPLQPLPSQLRKLVKSRLTDRLTVRRSDHGTVVRSTVRRSDRRSKEAAS